MTAPASAATAGSCRGSTSPSRRASPGQAGSARRAPRERGHRRRPSVCATRIASITRPSRTSPTRDPEGEPDAPRPRPRPPRPRVRRQARRHRDLGQRPADRRADRGRDPVGQPRADRRRAAQLLGHGLAGDRLRGEEDRAPPGRRAHDLRLRPGRDRGRAHQLHHADRDRALPALRGRDALRRPGRGRGLDGGDPRSRGARGGRADGRAHLVDAEGQREHPRALRAQPLGRAGLGRGDRRRHADPALRRDLGRSGHHLGHRGRATSSISPSPRSAARSAR